LSAQDLIDVCREEVESFNAGDWDRFQATYMGNAIYEEPGTQRRVEGRDEIVEINKGWREAFPDAHGTVTNAVAGDDTVTLEITWEGTQSGALGMPQGEIPPTNRRVTVKAAQVMKMADGEIEENHHYFDVMGMLEQLGVQ
jgi:steroid delta-isomerase-like uncharacterized protein